MLNRITQQDLTSNWMQRHPEPADIRDAGPDEEENTMTWSVKESFSDEEIEFLFPRKALSKIKWFNEHDKKEKYSKVKAVLTRLHIHSLNSYTYIRDCQAHTYASNEQQFLFMINEEKFKVIYRPGHEEPYFTYGEPSYDYMHGFDQAEKIMLKRIEEETYDDKAEKIEEIIIGRRLTDILGLALLGYQTCWFLDPLQILEPWDFIKLQKIAEKVYLLRDNTDEGKRLTHKCALDNLELYIIDVPEEFRPDDYADPIPVMNMHEYLGYNDTYALEQLIGDSYPYRFWEKLPQFEGRGDDREFVGYRYMFDYVMAYNFLNKLGFYRLAVQGLKTEYVFVRKNGNIISEVTPNNVKNFMHSFLKERRMDKKLRNQIYGGAQLGDTSLSNLEETFIDFTTNDENHQLMFFKNCTWEVTADGIKNYAAGELDRYVWEQDVIPHNATELPAPFEITRMPDGNFDIEIKDDSCLFLKYLIQTSRVHWRTELEESIKELSKDGQEKYKLDNRFNIAGPRLNDEERWEQKLHLMNKIYAIGYLMHEYRAESKPWAVIAMDNKISSDGKSYGGSGKSICFNQAIPNVVRSVFKIPGTNPRKTDDPHIFDGLQPKHRVTIIDDADRYLNFRFFFEYCGGDQVVNPKGRTSYTVKYKDAAKLIWIWNFAFTSGDPSAERRKLYTVFSDYYHFKGEGSDYKETRDPTSEFGKTLFSGFDQTEWNQFYNTMAYCLRFYLSCPVKLESPMETINKRNLQRDMGTDFEEWAKDYFVQMPDGTESRLDRYIVKEEAYEMFMKGRSKTFNYSMTKFKQSLSNWCMYHGYMFNPIELRNIKDGRIMYTVPVRKFDHKDKKWEVIGKDSKELFYIQTKFEGELKPDKWWERAADDFPF